MTLGELIAAIELLDNGKRDRDEPCVYVVKPYTLQAPHSHRSDYSQLAFALAAYDYGEGKAQVSDVLELLRSTDGATFEGWKGGDYKMTANTQVFVASPGCCGDAITGVMAVSYGDIRLVTAEEVW